MCVALIDTDCREHFSHSIEGHLSTQPADCAVVRILFVPRGSDYSAYSSERRFRSDEEGRSIESD